MVTAAFISIQQRLRCSVRTGRNSAVITAGLFDLQVNGYAGVDFNAPSITPKMLDHALDAMLADGVTGCLPTIITAHAEELEERLRALDAAVADSRLGPMMVPGYHLEGPFLNDRPGYHGCHPPAAMLDPNIELIDRLGAKISRPILLVTIAPERDGATALVQTLVKSGKTAAVGHSAATYEDIARAVDAGLSLSTHLGNGLPADLPKLENTLLAQLAETKLKACLIADGHHLSPDALGALVRLKGQDKCILVTDAVLAAGAKPGDYRFAGMDVTLSGDGAVRVPGGSGLAGSALRLDQAVRNIVAWSIAEPNAAIEMASARARNAIAEALKHAGISMDAGKIEWNSGLEPKVLTSGSIDLTSGS
ncbi:MAG: N-acetylglucosamine-6-phosphate deacetylase [Pseudomonadota bacterium]